MKHKKLRIFLATLISVLILGGLIATISCVYIFYGRNGQNWIFQAMWVTIIVTLFLFDGIIALVIFNTKLLSDELKAFWLFIVLIFPVAGCIFWLFIGVKQQKTYGTGQSSQTTLLSHIFKAKKSIKIYTNSAFFSYDTLKALNYVCWKGIKVEILLSLEPKKWKDKVLKFDISKNLKEAIDVHYTNKEINSSFAIVDDKEVLFNDKNFNFKNMYNNTVIYLTTAINPYLSLWNKDFIKSSKFDHNQNKAKWTTRFKYGIVNIFYSFF